MEYTEKELRELVKTVSDTFAEHLNSLAKSEDGSEKKEPPKEEGKEDKKPEEDKGEEKKDAAPAEEKAPEAKEGDKPSEGEKKPEGEEHKEGENKEVAPEGEKKPEGEQPQAPSDEDHGYDDEDMKHMHDMYGSMSRGELKAHHDAIRKCMDGMGLAKCEEGMQKSEKDISVELPADNSKELELLKSELATEKSKSAESEKNLAAVIESLTKFVKAPAGKSITSLDVIKKNSDDVKEPIAMSKSEIALVLTKKASNPALPAEDKAAINDYYFGSKNIEKVRHLLG